MPEIILASDALPEINRGNELIDPILLPRMFIKPNDEGSHLLAPATVKTIWGVTQISSSPVEVVDGETCIDVSGTSNVSVGEGYRIEESIVDSFTYGLSTLIFRIRPTGFWDADGRSTLVDTRSGPGGNGVLVLFNHNGGANNYEIKLQFVNGSNSYVTVLVASNSFVLDKWMTVIVAYDSVNAKIYVDGVKVAEGTHTTASHVGAEHIHGTIMGRTNSPITTSLDNFKGYLAYFAMYETYLSDEICESICENPYQFFEYERDAGVEYQLKSDIGQRLTFDNLQNSTNWAIEFEWQAHGVSGSQTYVFGRSDNKSINLSIKNAADPANNTLVWRSLAVNYTFGLASVPLDIMNVFRLEYDGADIHLYMNDIFVETKVGANGDISEISTLFNSGGTNAVLASSIKFFKVFDYNDSSNSRYWEFNQTRGDSVKCHWSGAIAKLVGFPSDSGYVKAVDVSDGLVFTAGQNQVVDIPSITLFNTTTWQVELRDFTFINESGITIGGDTENWIAISKTGITLTISDKVQTVTSWATALLSDVEYSSLKINCVSGTLTLSVNGAVSATATESRTDSQSLDGINVIKHYGAFYYPGTDTRATKIYLLGNGVERYYDFTKVTNNATVPETINGQDGALVGFDANEVYIQEQTKTLVGQEFYGGSAAFFTGMPEYLGGSYDNVSITMATPISNTGITQTLFDARIHSNGAYNSVGAYLLLNGGNGLWSSYRCTVTVDGVGVTTDLTALMSTVKKGSVINIRSERRDYIDNFYVGNSYQLTTPFNGGTVSSVGYYNENGLGSDVHLWDFTQDVGDTILDTSGNDNHGTVIGGELRRIYDYGVDGQLVGYKAAHESYANVAKFERGNFTVKARIFVPSNLAGRATVFATRSTTENTALGCYVEPDGRITVGSKNTVTNSGNYAWYFNTSTDKCQLDAWNEVEYWINPTTLTPTSVKVNGGAAQATEFGALQDWHSTAGWDTLLSFAFFATIRNNVFVYSNTGLIIQSAELIRVDTTIGKWDFTTGDSDTIVASVGDSLNIVSASTVKWQPIVPVDVYTVGATVGATVRDFADVDAFDAGVKYIGGHNKGIVYGTGPNGNLSDHVGVVQLTGESGSMLTGNMVCTRNNHTLVENLIVDGGISCYGLGETFKYHKLHVKNYSAVGINVGSTDDAAVQVTDSLFTASNRAIDGAVTSRTTVSGCIATDVSDIGFIRCNIINSVSEGANNSNFHSCIGSNNISSDATATTLGIGTGSVDFASDDGAFVDATNGDYRINQSWADTNLVGQGWNGSDIASWAYTSEVVTNIAVALTGTVAGSSEVDIQTGGNTIVLTLTGDTWLDADFDNQRQALIDGLVSAQSESTGWNNEVKDKEVVSSVVRTSDTIVTITLSAQVLYDITGNETITATIPDTVLTTGTSAVAADVTFSIVALSGGGFKIVWAAAQLNNQLLGGL